MVDFCPKTQSISPHCKPHFAQRAKRPFGKNLRNQGLENSRTQEEGAEKGRSRMRSGPSVRDGSGIGMILEPESLSPCLLKISPNRLANPAIFSIDLAKACTTPQDGSLRSLCFLAEFSSSQPAFSQAVPLAIQALQRRQRRLRRVPSKYASATPETTPTATPETTPTATPEATPTATPEATPTATPEATPTATPEATPTATPEATPTATPEATPTATPETTPTATPEATPTATPEATPTATPEATPTATPEATPTATPEATPTATPEATPTATPEATPTATPEATRDSGSYSYGDSGSRSYGDSGSHSYRDSGNHSYGDSGSHSYGDPGSHSYGDSGSFPYFYPVKHSRREPRRTPAVGTRSRAIRRGTSEARFRLLPWPLNVYSGYGICSRLWTCQPDRTGASAIAGEQTLYLMLTRCSAAPDARERIPATPMGNHTSTVPT